MLYAEFYSEVMDMLRSYGVRPLEDFYWDEEMQHMWWLYVGRFSADGLAARRGVEQTVGVVLAQTDKKFGDVSLRLYLGR